MEEHQQTQQHEQPWDGQERRKQEQGDYTGEERRKAAAANDVEGDEEKDADPEATQH